MNHNTGEWKGWPKNRTAIIAEVGMNHGGDEGLAWEMIQSAHENGADLVKLQSYITEEFFHPSLPYFSNTKSMEMPFEVQKRLFKKASGSGIELITTSYDFATVDMVDEFEPAAHKIASMDNDNVPLIRHTAEKQRPILIAVGMASLEEIQSIVDIVKQAGNDKLVLLHCISDYPARPEDLNLSMIKFLREKYSVPVGTSDHSLGLWSSFAAASMGAVAIEKHFTTDRALLEKIPDADHDISIEPAELKELSDFCKMLPAMMGTAPRTYTEGEKARRKDFRRGLYAVRDILQGEKVSMDNIILLRPVSGIHAGRWDEVSGKEMIKDVKKGQPITDADLGL